VSAPPVFDFAKADDDASAEKLDALADQLKIHERAFVLYPTMWKRWDHSPTLTWSSVRFESGAKASVPASRGLYVFLAIPQTPSALPPAIGFPLYVGETGDESGANLRSRFGQYLVEVTGTRRLKFYRMARKLEGHIFFAFAPVADPTISLKALETKLTDALVPPMGDQDFSAEMRAARKAM
jgi:hypothetical protein